MQIGDQIVIVNGHGDISADVVSDYLKTIRSPTINTIVVRRLEGGRIASRVIKFTSTELPDSCIGTDRKSVCVWPVSVSVCP